MPTNGIGSSRPEDTEVGPLAALLRRSLVPLYPVGLATQNATISAPTATSQRAASFGSVSIGAVRVAQPGTGMRHVEQNGEGGRKWQWPRRVEIHGFHSMTSRERLRLNKRILMVWCAESQPPAG